MVVPMRQQVEEIKQLYIERHEYRAATEADFKGRDRKWYEKATGELVALGYRQLGDIVNETVAKAAGMIVVIRRFISPDGTNGAAIYHMVRPGPFGLPGLDLRICDLESELSDGSFLTSSNAEAGKSASMPPQIRDTKYPADTTIPELVSLHEASKKKLLKKRPNLRLIEIRSAEEYQAAQHRQEAIKAAFRKGIGYLDPAEVRRIAEQKMPDDPASAAVVAVTADIARKQAQIAESGRGAGLLAMMSLLGGAGGEEPADEKAKLAVDAMLASMPGQVPQDKREEIAGTMKDLMTSVHSGEGSGVKNLFKLMGQLQGLEPEEQKEAKRKKFEEVMAKSAIESKKRQAAHVKKRLARGLSKEAGTGEAGPEVFIHALPTSELDYEDKPRGLGDMIKEINASKARRDAGTMEAMPLGHSRVGGLPDLPPDHPWPMHKGKKIPFIAQINLGDCPKSVHALLPKSGHLYVFALISNDKKHWPPPVSVFVYEGKTASLIRADYPADNEIWPDWTEARVYQGFPSTMVPKDRDRKKRSSVKDETLGYLLGEMSGVFGTAGEIADDRMQDGDDWINLLALYSVGSMEWSDAGELYVLIRRSALEARDFSNVLAAACSS